MSGHSADPGGERFDGGRVVCSIPAPGIRLLTLNRPAVLNAFDHEMVEDLRAETAAAAADDTCRAVVITGAGRAFSAGLDIRGALARRAHPLDPQQKLRNQERFTSMVAAWRELPHPTIAAVNGAAVGVAFALALTSDVRVAAPSAVFHIGAIKRGLTSGESGISYLLPRIIGAGRAFEILLTGRPIDADEAERIGLVTALAADDAGVVSLALALAREITGNTPFGVAQTKRLMWANLDMPSYVAAVELENRAQMLVSMGPDTGEAMQAFVEKRPPSFSPRVASEPSPELT